MVKYQKQLSKLVAASQRSLYAKFVDLMDDLDLDDAGQLKSSGSNYAKRKDISLIVSAYGATQGRSLAKWIYGKVMKLFGLNKNYFKTIVPSLKESVENRARRKVLLDLGYNEKKKELIKDGWLYAITNNTNLVGKTIKIFNDAFTSGTSLKDFRSNFKNFFLGGKGLGQLEKDFYTQTFDVFQKYDRTIGLVYADDLGLSYGIWAGVPKKTTTDFCRRRSNQLFDRETMKKWESQTWSGKKPNHNIFTDGHGYNCRYVIDWISNQLAEQLIKTRGLNQFNSI